MKPIEQLMHCGKYYTYMDALKERFKAQSRQMGFKAESPTDYEQWKKALRRRLADITGLTRLTYTDPAPEKLETVQMEGYSREKWIMQTEPGVTMPFYILFPDGCKSGGKNKVIIAPHGHGSAGKYCVAGRTDIPFVANAVKTYNYAYGVEFVKRGYTVFCPDARGFGERRETNSQGDSEEAWLRQSCLQLNQMAIPMGITVMGMWIWDLMRLTDYIVSRNDCDADHIACCGLSGGGLQTLYFTAMDDRIRCGITSGYFYGSLESLVELTQLCSCNYVPHLWETCDMGDIGALIAPRPFLIESGRQDPLNGKRGLENVKEQLDITGKAYDLFNARDFLIWHIFDGPHMWNGEKSYDFIQKYI